MTDNPQNVADLGSELLSRLRALSPTRMRLTDESHLHRGHPGAKNGVHFRLEITSPQFSGLRPLERHRLVYGAAGDLAALGIHALSVRALAPEEVSRPAPV